MIQFQRLLTLTILASILTNCKSSQSLSSGQESETLGAGGQGVADTTLVDDSTQKVGGVYQMGVRKPGIDGIACRKFAGQAGVNFDSGKEFVFYVAPSDAFFGKTCAKNPYGGEPTCHEVADQCGKRVEISCNDPENCTRPGERSMFSKIIAGEFRDAKGQNSTDSVNDLANILKSHYAGLDINNIPTPKSIVLVVNDFCPKNHSKNGGHCSGPHLDISNAAYLLYGKANAQNYISPNVKVNYIFHDNKTTELGPKW
jgi:hypothetical protein